MRAPFQILTSFILGMIVGVFFMQSIQPRPTSNHQTALEGAVVPFFSKIDTTERQSLAESFDIAAGRLEQGDCRFLVDEYIRTSIAIQPSSGQWANDIDKIVQTAWSADAVIYARNLRAIAKGLKKSPLPLGEG